MVCPPSLLRRRTRLRSPLVGCYARVSAAPTPMAAVERVRSNGISWGGADVQRFARMAYLTAAHLIRLSQSCTSRISIPLLPQQARSTTRRDHRWPVMKLSRLRGQPAALASTTATGSTISSASRRRRRQSHPNPEPHQESSKRLMAIGHISSTFRVIIRLQHRAIVRNGGIVSTAVDPMPAGPLANARGPRHREPMHRPPIPNHHQARSSDPMPSPMALAQNIPGKTHRQDRSKPCPRTPIQAKTDPFLPPPSSYYMLSRS